MKSKLAKWLVLGTLCPVAAFSEGIREGEWEFSNTMKTPGMPDLSELAKQLPPGMKLPGGMEFGGSSGGVTVKLKHCVTNADPKPPMKDDDKMKCEMTRQKREGTRFEWAMRCTGDNTDMISEGKAVYDGASMTSEVNTRGTVEGQPAEMQVKTSGRYLGPCPAKS